MNNHPFQRIAIIGLGLIGSSLARCIRAEGLSETIIGADENADVLARVEALGLCDGLTADIATAVDGADLIIVCVPVKRCAAVAVAMRPVLKQGAIVTDVGSVKAFVQADVMPHIPPGVHFIPGHPVAGTEQSGPDAGFASLFKDRWTILTPPDGTDAAAIEKLRLFWQQCGASVEIMDADRHDMVLAITSHLPHLIAYSIVGTAADLEEVSEGEVLKFSAGGFRDFTRIAASDPTMWRDVFLTNKDAVLEMLGRFSEDLAALQRAIRWDKGDALYERFERTRDVRRGIIDVGQETAAPNFGRARDE